MPLSIKSDCRAFIQIRLDLRDLVALIHCSPIVEDGVIDSVGSLANREREAATYCNFEHLFLLNRFKSSWMVTHFAISDSNFTIRVRAPDHSLVVCVDNDEE